MKKLRVLGVILFLIPLSSLISAGNTFRDVHMSMAMKDGSLSGYVTDPLLHPLVGAIVIVFFHGTYAMNVTDSLGYYHVTNIPICNCTKKAVACKEGYQAEVVLLSIDFNTTYNFVLSPQLTSDISAWGNLLWEKVRPGETVSGELWVMNIGGSDLEWDITEHPSWGVWEFGLYIPALSPGGLQIVAVQVTAPSPANTTFIGQVNISNKRNTSDFDLVSVSLSTQHAEGFSVSERLIGIIRNLQIEDNTTSFQMLIGFGIRIVEYDDGGITAFAIPYFLRQIQWSGDVVFYGTLRPHYIKGIVSYRVTNASNDPLSIPSWNLQWNQEPDQRWMITHETL